MWNHQPALDPFSAVGGAPPGHENLERHFALSIVPERHGSFWLAQSLTSLSEKFDALSSLTVWPRTAVNRVPRVLRRGLLVGLLSLALLVVGFGEFTPSAVDLAAAPHRYSILSWEVNNLPDKWFRKLGDALPWRSEPSREEQIAQAREFFKLGQEQRRLERQLLFPERQEVATTLSPQEVRSLRGEIASIEERRRRLQGSVEETLESQIALVLEQQGLASGIGIFPPVDAVFSSSPHVLVLSPRDRIERRRDVLLEPGLTSGEKEAIEDRIFIDEDLSALVEDTGGLAVYPSVVIDSAGLHNAVVITTHEWLHHWLFFRPLGRAFWSGPEMATLNETVATVAGEELGDRAFIALTGEEVNRPPPEVAGTLDLDGFDFRAEMQQTRIRAEELLAQGKIEEAEAYMEQRRRLFVANGHLIRKLNQAYFAFHGTYATSAASVSPIGDQVRDLRERSESVADFLETAARFGTYQEFLDHLDGLSVEVGATGS